MKLSLLDMTQSILSAMDSDQVSSIDETVEAIQVADIIKEAYFELMSQRDWPFLFSLGSLVGLADLNNPTKMKIPDGWNKIKWIKYNKKEVIWVPPDDFHEMIETREELADVIDANGFGINSDPKYWTSYDDVYVVFDSIDNTIDNTLQQSKSTIYGTVQQTWTHENSFIPNIPEKFFPTLLAEAKAQAFVNLKQQPNNREEVKARRGRVTMQNEAWKNERGESKTNMRVNYGRK